MTGFSAQWLALREPADHRARDRTLQNKVCEQLANVARTEQRAVRLIDLGCGSGSNLRALATSLPEQQHWTLVDYDPLLLAAARAALIAWADEVINDSTSLTLRKNNKILEIEKEFIINNKMFYEFIECSISRDIKRAEFSKAHRLHLFWKVESSVWKLKFTKLKDID